MPIIAMPTFDGANDRIMVEMGYNSPLRVPVADNPGDFDLQTRLVKMPNGAYAIRVCRACGAYVVTTEMPRPALEIVDNCQYCGRG